MANFSFLWDQAKFQTKRSLQTKFGTRKVNAMYNYSNLIHNFRYHNNSNNQDFWLIHDKFFTERSLDFFAKIKNLSFVNSYFQRYFYR